SGYLDIFVQKFNSSGTAVGSKTQLDGQGGDDYAPQIIALDDGGFVVTWQGPGGSGHSDIFIQKFDSNGNAVGSEKQLDGQGGDDYAPQITALDDGGFVVTWYGDGGSGHEDIFVQKFNSSGNAVGSETQLDGQGGDDYDPQITALDDGGFVVTWEGYDSSSGNYDIFVQKFNSSGTAVGSKIQLDGQGGNDERPQITALTDGGFVVTWYGDDGSGHYDIFVQQFDSRGNSVSAQSSEAGTGYLVHSTVAVSSVNDITSSADNLWNSVDITSADTPTAMSTAGLSSGTYYLYTVDAAGNLSAQSAASYTIPLAAPTLALATDSGSSSTDGITNVATINVSGLEVGATWQYQVDNNGTWIDGTGTSFDATTGS
ncbi:MAG: hypothetical protein IE883_08045, partial [Epsilonproteobacteria bacterium]|nr:hypothetical protein [Campylobacterota bacterium]